MSPITDDACRPADGRGYDLSGNDDDSQIFA